MFMTDFQSSPEETKQLKEDLKRTSQTVRFS